MRPSPSNLRRFAVLAGTVVIAVGWFMWLRPTALGGRVSYVVVQGSSMEPTYDDGDLVLVREEAKYSHGDVIAFHAGGTFDDPTRIIHRIVGDAGNGGFTTQGDNRDRTDPWQPHPDDVIGRAFFHVPMAGDLARFVTRPESFAAIGGAAVIVGGERRRRRRRLTRRGLRPDGAPPMSGPHKPSFVAAAVPRSPRSAEPRWALAGLVATAVLAIPVLALTWSALRAPDSTQHTQQVGEVAYGIDLDYRFSGAPSAVYPTGVVTTTRNPAGAVVPSGPLYSRLLDRLDIDMSFRARGQGTDRLASTYAIDVKVETPGGWSTPLDSVPPTRFDGDGTQTVSVDLRAVEQQVASVAALTGVGGDAFTIAVEPKLDVTGTSEVGEVSDALSAPMTFALKDSIITANAVAVSDTQPLTRTTDERATYALGPFDLGTQAARGVLGGLSLVLVAGIAWFASVLFGGVGLAEPDRIAARYRSQIVDVAAAAAPPGPVVMVGAIDELARIAKVEQTVILHEDLGDGAHRYRVFLGTVTYEYEAAPEHAGAATDAEATANDENGA
jgi:signal peptidase I